VTLVALIAMLIMMFKPFCDTILNFFGFILSSHHFVGVLRQEIEVLVTVWGSGAKYVFVVMP